MKKCSCVKVKRNSRKANYAAKNAPPFCEIWFIHKGKLIWTREASENPCSLSSHAQPEIVASESLRIRSFQDDKNELFQSECLESNSARTVICTGTGSFSQDEIVEIDATSSFKSSSCTSSCSPQNSAGGYLETYPDIEEERICAQLTEVKIQVEAAMDEAFAELLKCKRLEAEATEAIKKVSLTYWVFTILGFC